MRLLQEIVRERVAGDPREVGAERPGGPVVESAERLLVHFERHGGVGVFGAEPLNFCKRQVTH